MVAEPGSVAAVEGSGYARPMAPTTSVSSPLPVTLRGVRFPLARLAAVLLVLSGVTMAAGPSTAGTLLLPCSREGSWTAADKQLHFGVSLAIAASLRVEGRSRIESVAGTVAVGVVKEIYDVTLKPRRLGRGASRKDLAADLLGAVAGVLLIAAVDR